jgi:FixJ family two-component response regulator
MPGMNGVELLALAREIDASMPGMIITGFSDPDVLPDFVDVKVLCKPFNRHELAEAVQSLMTRRHSDHYGALQPV